MKIHYLRRRSGYTLVETMLVVTIIGIVAVLGSQFFLQVENFYFMSRAKFEIQKDARVCLSNISHFLQEAQDNTIVIDNLPNQGIYSRIKFTTIDGRQFVFWQQGNQLLQQITTTSGIVNNTTLSQNLAYITFGFPQSSDPTIVSVALSMARSIQLGRKEVLLMTTQTVRIMNP